MKRLSQRAEEILDEAMRLFAERGYEGTSVADIQVAAGMTPGSGALYKHFVAKQALLEAGIDRFIEEFRDATRERPEVAGVDPRDALHTIGSLVLKTLSHDQPALRVAWRDLPAFPELNARFVNERLQVGFKQMTGWFAELAEANKMEIDDPQALVGVLLSSLAFYRLMDGLLGAKPARLGEERFLTEWVDVAAAALGVPERPRSRRPE